MGNSHFPTLHRKLPCLKLKSYLELMPSKNCTESSFEFSCDCTFSSFLLFLENSVCTSPWSHHGWHENEKVVIKNNLKTYPLYSTWTWILNSCGVLKIPPQVWHRSMLLECWGTTDLMCQMTVLLSPQMNYNDKSHTKVHTMEKFMSYPSQKRLPILAQF